MHSFHYSSILIILLGLSAPAYINGTTKTVHFSTSTKNPSTLKLNDTVDSKPLTKDEMEKAKKNAADVKIGNASRFDFSPNEKEHNDTQFAMVGPRPYIVWPGGRVPYILSPTLPDNFRYALSIAMERLRMHSCINFFPRTYEPVYIRFMEGGICKAYIDPQRSEQMIQLGGLCDSAAVIMHLIGHTLGMTHEHQRADRDSFVQVFMQNVDPRSANNFLRFPSPYNSFGELRYPYDPLSIMHYPSWFGNGGGRGPSITLLSGGHIEQAQFLSHFDSEKLRNAHCLYQ